jgi:hypothetical protein
LTSINKPGREGERMKILSYNPDQAYLLPTSLKYVLGENHLCFFVQRVVDELDLREFGGDYVEGGRGMHRRCC